MPPAMPPMLPMLPQPRPVAANWTCQRSGECCTRPAEVLMTVEERMHLLPHIPQGIATFWRDSDVPGFVLLKAQPCPFFIFKSCVVYEHRPYNCRRFGCMRPDPKTEPWEEDRQGNCLNQMARILNSRVARRLAELMQRKAQRWGDKHGWLQHREKA